MRILVAAMVAGTLGLFGGAVLAKADIPWVSCTVGYTGTDMNVTIDGVGSTAECASLTTGQDRQLGDMAVYSTDPSGTLMCRYKVNGLTYTVRDTGSLKLYGHQQCDAFQQYGQVMLGSNATPGPTAGKIPG